MPPSVLLVLEALGPRTVSNAAQSPALLLLERRLGAAGKICASLRSWTHTVHAAPREPRSRCLELFHDRTHREERLTSQIDAASP